MKRIDPSDFPPDLRSLISLPYGSDSSMYAEEFKTLATQQLHMALMILDMKYFGLQIDKRKRIAAEVRRRHKQETADRSRSANLPREEHWWADFRALWDEACRPFRRLKELSHH